MATNEAALLNRHAQQAQPSRPTWCRPGPGFRSLSGLPWWSPHSDAVADL